MLKKCRYLRVIAATNVGNLMGDKNMTMWGDIWAQQAIQEFERFDTLSEVYHMFQDSMIVPFTDLSLVQLWNIRRSNSLCAFTLGIYARELYHIKEGTRAHLEDLDDHWTVLQPKSPYTWWSLGQSVWV